MSGESPPHRSRDRLFIHVWTDDRRKTTVLKYQKRKVTTTPYAVHLEREVVRFQTPVRAFYHYFYTLYPELSGVRYTLCT